jgi:hypothetical protein
VALSTLNSACDDRLFWPLVLQINSQCKAKKREAERFMQALDSTFIIGSTLLNEQSFTLFHLSQRVLHASSIFATTDLPSDVSTLSADRFTRYLTLNGDEDLKNLDYLQLHHPLFSDGYALAYAEYTQKFKLQYYGLFHGGSETPGANEHTCDTLPGSSADVEDPACQLTFEQTLNSVFPLTDTVGPSHVGRKSKIDAGIAHAALFACTTSALIPSQANLHAFVRQFSIQLEQQAA